MRAFFRWLRRAFFFFLFLVSQGFLCLVHIFFALVQLWVFWLRPLIVDFLRTVRDIFVDYLLMPFLSFIGSILGFFVRKALKFLLYSMETFSLFFFFFWEICEWKKYRQEILLIIFILLWILLWWSYFTLLGIIYEGACQCCLERGPARCGPIFTLLGYTTFIFFELWRALDRFLKTKVLRK